MVSQLRKELLEFGIINIDKPSGPTSFNISDFVRKNLKVRKTSHFGTLDPKVTGVLPIGFGGWAEGIVIGIIQALLLSVFGVLTGKMGLWNLVIVAIVIFVGGIVGGIAAGYFSLTGLYATIIILAIQTLILSFAGFLGGKPSLKV